jgi:hypothetical protein
MHPQLQAVVDEFDAASTRLHSLAARLDDAQWQRRAEAGRWSMAECVAHLNLTSQAFLPILDDAIARARRATAGAGQRVDSPSLRYRRDPLGWLLWKVIGPPVRIRTRTPPAFVPTGTATARQLIAEFDRLQHEQIARVRAADGLPLQRVKVRSPFDERVKYNLYACLTILPRHQHRHLWQAEQVRLALGRPQRPD